MDKVAHLRTQIKQLEDGSDPEYLRRVKELRELCERRVFVAEVFKQYELDETNEEFEREKTLAVQQFEAKGMELKECLLNDLQDKKKAYDSYRHSMDLASGGMKIPLSDPFRSSLSPPPSPYVPLQPLIPLSPRTW